MSGAEVKKRCVFFLGGYEPIPPERQHERFIRELARFERTWNVTASVSDMSLSDDGAIALWRIETRGPNWTVETEYRSLLWDDMVVADFGRSDWVRVPRGDRGLRRFHPVRARRGAISRSTGAMGCSSSIRFSSSRRFVAAAIAAAWLGVRLGMPLPFLFAPALAYRGLCRAADLFRGAT